MTLLEARPTLGGAVQTLPEREGDPQPPPDDRMSLDVPEGTVPPAMGHGCSTSARGASDASGWSLGILIAGIALRSRRRRTI